MDSLTFMGGLLLGLASSLHCAGMCGAIGASLAMGFSPAGTVRDRVSALAAAQAGKLVAYVLAGVIAGALGAGVYGLLDREAAFRVAQIAGAAALIWTGLSLLHLAPSPALLDRLFAPLRRVAWRARRTGPTGAGLAGLAWGLMPCGMVYAAILYAMLSGGAVRGGLVMAGFGLGVMPSVTAAALGVSSLPQFARGRLGRGLAGGGLIVLGVASLVWPSSSLMALCAPAIRA